MATTSEAAERNAASVKTRDRRPLRVAVIGAGASGIGAAIRLVQAGFDDVTVFEKSAELGGTWRDNTYPGLSCDIPSHLYRYSFAPNAEWTFEYSGGPEIKAYFQAVAERFGVFRRIRFGEELRRAEFRDGRWHLATTGGDQGGFDALVAATGVLHVPRYPDIPGREDFAGAAFHSSRWDHSVPLEGKRVGIIGTGSTATQILPAIVDRVAHVALFQRTPQWIIKLENKPIPDEKKAVFRSDPSRMASLYDYLNGVFNEKFASSLVGQNDAGLAEMAQGCRDNLATVRDPELRRRLTPDYVAGCKRLVVSDKFYPAIQRPNAGLVDDPIERIEPGGIRTRDGELHPLDVLVYATGFDPFAFFHPAAIVGRDGVHLNDRWAEGCRAYRTAMVPGFPNFFIIGGPNSPIGNFSFLRTAELQIDYVVSLIELLAGGTAREVEPTEASTAAFNAALEGAMPDTIWAKGGCTSWYFDRQGKVASWPWSYDRFMTELARPELADLRLS